MQIRKIRKEERGEALSLVLDTFMQYEAPDYSREGVETFRSYIGDEKSIENFVIYGAFDMDEIIGVIATKTNGNHISLFFVDGQRHKQGIGKKLFEEAVQNSTAERITVNSSPYAVEVYRHLGFVPTDTEQLTDAFIHK